MTQSADVHDPTLGRQLARLRFDGSTEAEFRSDYERQSPPARITLQLLGLALIGITPLYDERLLSAPSEFLAIARVLDFGVEIPAILVSLILTLLPGLRRYSAPATALSTLLIATCLMVQRLAGMPHDFHVPHDLPVVAIAAVLVLSRLRVFYILPWTLAILALTIGLELYFKPGPDALFDSISVLMLYLISLIAAYLIERSARESWYRGRLLERIALKDSLTGLSNRRHFDSELYRLISIAQREQRGLALMIFDIDRFKAYNDFYGHPTGDQCLRRIGHHLDAMTRRPLDLCARIGGEEFAAVWYDIKGRNARRMAEDLRLSIEKLAIIAAPGDRPSVSASAGLVVLEQASAGDATAAILDSLMRKADAALYRAKHAGRATLIVAD